MPSAAAWAPEEPLLITTLVKWDWFIVVRGLIEKNGVKVEVRNDAYPVAIEAE